MSAETENIREPSGTKRTRKRSVCPVSSYTDKCFWDGILLIPVQGWTCFWGARICGDSEFDISILALLILLVCLGQVCCSEHVLVFSGLYRRFELCLNLPVLSGLRICSDTLHQFRSHTFISGVCRVGQLDAPQSVKLSLSMYAELAVRSLFLLLLLPVCQPLPGA